jgi:hypothetical protein
MYSQSPVKTGLLASLRGSIGKTGVCNILPSYFQC